MDATTQPAETYESLASMIDYPLLDPMLSAEDVAEGCRMARKYAIRAVVVRPCDLQLVVQWLSGSGVLPVSVAGHPDGISTTAVKLYEGRDLLRIGSREIEFVLNPASLLARSFQHIETELQQISQSCHQSGAKLTVVYNNRRLAEDHKIIATKISRRIEADTLSIDHSDADLALLRPMLKDVLKLKRATSVESLEEALAARDAGYASFTSLNPAGVLEAWKAHLAALQAPAT
jgi:deoxyribose-phosphate aldolase